MVQGYSGVLDGYANVAWGVLRLPYDMAQFLGAWLGNDWNADYGKRAISAGWNHFASGFSWDASPEHFGESFGSVLIAAGSAGSAFAEGGMFSSLAYATRWDTPAGLAAIEESGRLKAGAFVQRGRGGFMDYMLSGAAERGYPFGSKMTRLVPKSALVAPKYLEAFKYLVRQRIFLQDYHF